MTDNDLDVAELESTLRKEELELVKDKEIQRILNQFKLDYYSVLEVQPGIAEKDITKIYRKKSLLIHPDKTTNPKAVEAFDCLKKASSALLDEAERAKLDEIWTDARSMLMKQHGWTIDDARLTGSEFLREWRAKVKELLIEEEFMRQVELKKQQKEEARKRQEEEQETDQRRETKRLKENWESKRDDRVHQWRQFSRKLDDKKKKKKARSNVLV